MIVIESSALVDALVDSQPNIELLNLLAEADLHAPALVDFEVASALRGHMLGRKLTTTRMREAVDDFTALHLQRYPMTNLLTQILDLRSNFTTYDAAYVVLARILEAPLVTADYKMLEAEKLGVQVRILRSH